MVGIGGPNLDPAEVRLTSVLDEREAIVVQVRPYDVHGAPHVEIVLGFSDQQVETTRLGRESAPPDLASGDRVLVRFVMRTIVEVTRAPGGATEPN